MSIDFLKPASIDDVVLIETEPTSVRGARIVLHQAISRDGETLLRASVTVALVGPAGRAMRLPPAVVAALKPAE